MNHGAPVLDAAENKQEPLIERTRIQDSPTSVQIHEQLASESSRQSVQSIEALVDQLVIRIQAIGEEYLERIRSAGIEFMDRVDRSGSTSSSILGSNINPEITNALDGQILDASEDLKGQREMLREEIKNLKRRWGGQLFEKIIQTEDLVLNEDIRIQRMIDDPTVELGGLIRAYARNREMKAYVQGLKFRVVERAEL